MSLEKTTLLIAEDELSLRTLLKKLFQKKGFEVETAGDGELALKKLREHTIALAIVDIKMPGLSGLDVLATAKREGLCAYIIVMTAQDTMKNAIDAMKRGAYDYIAKPFELEELEMLVDKALEARRLSEEVKLLRNNLSESYDREARIVGNSKVVREIYKLIGKVAASDVSVLITGESGTGKELVARAIHQHSARADRPFIAVNCAAIPKDLLESELFGYRKGAFTGADESRAGFFELAHKGTLFLDEIGDLPLNLQAKLLRILQEKEVQRLGASEAKSIDVRILAATNQSLEKLAQEKKFREDLFFRLNVIPFHLAPLRERLEDLPLLCEFFLERMEKDLGGKARRLAPDAIALLQAHPWPGNIRELENIVKRAAILSGHETLSKEDFAFFEGKPPILSEAELETMGLEALIESRLKPFVAKIKETEVTDLYPTLMQMAERPLIKLVLKETGYNRIKAARILGINRNTLRKKIQELNIVVKEEL